MRTRLDYQCLGDADLPSIMMVPGWAMPKETMLSLAVELSHSFYVTLVDLPGISSNNDSVQLTRLGMNYDIDALSEQLIEIAPASSWWIGWSLGGMIATYIAARRSSAVEGLITFATSPSFVVRSDWPYGMPSSEFDAFSALVSESPAESLRRFIGLQSKGAKSPRSIMKSLQHHICPDAFNGLALEGGLRLLNSLDLRREFELLDCPNLHILGRDDALVMADFADKINQISGLDRHHVIENCAHQPFLEYPELCLDMINHFIDASR